MAVERNNSIANANLDIRAAEAKKWAAIAEMLPQVNLSADYSDMLGYKMNFGEMEVAMPPYVDMSVQTSVAFNGAMMVSAQISDISKRMSDISLKQTTQEVESQVKTLYYSALVSQQVLELLGRNLADVRKLHEMTLTAVNVGTTEQTEADRLAVQMSQLENSIASSRRSLEMVFNSLRLQLNVPVDTEIVLTATLEDLLAVDEFMALLAEDFALDNNYNYQLMKENTLLAQKQLAAAKWATTPTISAFHNYTVKEYFSDEMTMNMTPPNMVGVAVKIPIFSSLKHAKNIQAARSAYEKQLNTMNDTENQLMVQHRQLCFNLNTAYDSYNTQKQNMELMQRVFDNTSKKFEQGYTSAMDVTTSGTTLIQAQSSYIQALMEFVNAEIALEKLLSKE